MRQVVVAGVEDVRVQDTVVPTPGEGELLVRTIVAGVCGSDLHAVRGRHPFMTFPFYPGHEVVGEVAERGPGVVSPADGSRVVVEPNLYCGQCKQCRSGTYNLCERLDVFGCTTPSGGMADYFVIPAERVHLVPAGLSDRAAALIEPLATPVHAVRVAGDLRGAAVVVLGAGTIGLLTAAAARDAGARRVVVTDVLDSKRERALRLGADAVVDASRTDAVAQVLAELGESADVVFDCVAVQKTMDQAIPLAFKGGTIVVVGIAGGDVRVPLADVQDKQLRIQGTAMYTAEDFATSIRMLSAGAIDIDEIVTATLPMEQAAEAFVRAARGDEVKVVMRTR